MSAPDAVERLRVLLRHPTVSRVDDPAVFDAFEVDVRTMYPHVDGFRIRSTARGLHFLIPGRTTDTAATVLLAHYDVVPAAGQPWTSDPFAADVRNGAVYARGAIDDKGRLTAILEAVQRLLVEGWRPEVDVHLVFGDDEEIVGDTAKEAASWFAREGRGVGLLLDEGTGIVEGDFPNIDRPVAIVGVAERGSLSVRIGAHHDGGHASRPPREYATTRLLAALSSILEAPREFELLPALTQFLAGLAEAADPDAGPHYRSASRAPALAEAVLRAAGDEYDAWGRDTEALTMLSASEAANVLPTSASAVFDVRLRPGRSAAAAVEAIRARIADPTVSVSTGYAGASSVVSRWDDEIARVLRDAVASVAEDAVVVPGIMSGATDARHFAPASDHVYRFTPVRWQHGQRDLLHAADEYLTIEQFVGMIDFYRALLGAR